MPTAYKYSQVQGTAGTGTYATLYTTPAATQAAISSIVICNQSSSQTTFNIGLVASAGTPSASQFLVFGGVLASNDTIALTLGIAMDPSKFIRISSSASACSFTAFVSEIT